MTAGISARNFEYTVEVSGLVLIVLSELIWLCYLLEHSNQAQLLAIAWGPISINRPVLPKEQLGETCGRYTMKQEDSWPVFACLEVNKDGVPGGEDEN